MDLDALLDDGTLTEATKLWMEPLFRQDEDDAQEAKEAAAHDIFRDDPNENSLHRLVENTSIIINGKTIKYQIDDNSTGHGNRVWAASIATCFYLFDLINFSANDHPVALRSLELGAGTALPSLYLANILADQKDSYPFLKPVVHITDAKQYRNIRQIVASVVHQPRIVRQSVQFRVSPHDWGVGFGAGDGDCSFLEEDCIGAPASNSYDLVVVSDCIYNFNSHAKLLLSISRTLAFPNEKGGQGNGVAGGCAIVSFSLHGNASEDAVWKFLELVQEIKSPDGRWMLHTSPVSSLTDFEKGDNHNRGGWNMEEAMKKLGLWIAHLEPQRWIAHLYEIRWIPAT